MQPTTAASAVIDHLEPKERAVLFTALKFYNDMMEENLEQAQFSTDKAPTVSQFVKRMCLWNTGVVKNINTKLFQECFLEDLSVEKHMFDDFQNSNEAVVSHG